MFFSIPNSLLKGSGCPKCSNLKNARIRSLSNDDFASRLCEIAPTIIPVSKYINSNTKIKVHCEVCNFEWDALPSNLLKKHGCPRCASVKVGLNNRLDSQEFIKKLHNINKNVELLEDYVSRTHLIKTKCLKCGNVWKARPSSLLNNNLCPKCLSYERKFFNRMSPDEFARKILTNNKVRVLGSYEESSKKIEVQCLKCDRIWLARPSSIILGHGCKFCENNVMKTHEQFIKDLNKINKTVTLIDKYFGNKNKIKCSCNICGNEWGAYPNNLLKGEGCPFCSHTSTSFPEQLILESLKYVLGDEKVESRNKSVIGKELDIFVPKYNLAIEYGSWYWHKSRYEKDLEKSKLCLNKGINLVVIMDSCDKKLDYNCDFIFVNKNLSSEYKHITLKNIILKIIHKYIKEIEFSDEEWEKIENKAYAQSKKITTEDFVSRLESVNDKIIILSEYTKAKNKVKCLCKICNNRWEATPDKLLRGRGCPKCGHKKAWVTRKTKR